MLAGLLKNGLHLGALPFRDRAEILLQVGEEELAQPFRDVVRDGARPAIVSSDGHKGVLLSRFAGGLLPRLATKRKGLESGGGVLCRQAILAAVKLAVGRHEEPAAAAAHCILPAVHLTAIAHAILVRGNRFRLGLLGHSWSCFSERDFSAHEKDFRSGREIAQE